MCAAIVPSGQTHQLVGLPPLSDETMAKLDSTLREMYREAVQGAGDGSPSDTA